MHINKLYFLLELENLFFKLPIAKFLLDKDLTTLKYIKFTDDGNNDRRGLLLENKIIIELTTHNNLIYDFEEVKFISNEKMVGINWRYIGYKDKLTTIEMSNNEAQFYYFIKSLSTNKRLILNCLKKLVKNCKQ